MDRKAGCVTVQPTSGETVVGTLDFVRAERERGRERDQLPVSGALLTSSYWSSQNWRVSSGAVCSSSLLRGFSGVHLLKRQLECVVFFLLSVTTPWQWHVSFGCHVNIWLCCVGVRRVSAEVECHKQLKKTEISSAPALKKSSEIQPITKLQKNFLFPVIVAVFVYIWIQLGGKKCCGLCFVVLKEDEEVIFFWGKLCCMLKHTFHWNA